MAMTALDPRVALIVIDMQRGIALRDNLAPYPASEIVDRAGQLVDRFHKYGHLVVMVNGDAVPPGRTDRNSGSARPQLPTEGTELIDEFAPQPDDLVVTKHSRSAFAGTGLLEELRSRGVTQVAVVGIASGAGVESTARDAHEAGFNVTLPIDAMTDSDGERHAHSVREVFPQIAETGSTAELLELLDATAQ